MNINCLIDCTMPKIMESEVNNSSCLNCFVICFSVKSSTVTKNIPSMNKKRMMDNTRGLGLYRCVIGFVLHFTSGLK